MREIIYEKDARMVRFMSWQQDHDIEDLTPEQRAAIWTWIDQGGPAPWDPVTNSGAQPYPPAPTAPHRLPHG